MKNEELLEKANINDELLVDVSGGSNTPDLRQSLCPVCKQFVEFMVMVNHGGRMICKNCKDRLYKG